jgi:hypothetical protein
MHDPSGLSTRVPLSWRHARLAARQVTSSVTGRVGALDQGGPSACCLAHSTMAKDKGSPSGGRTEALLDGRPPLPSSEEPSASPLGGRR